jgi:hypothetical protein
VISGVPNSHATTPNTGLKVPLPMEHQNGIFSFRKSLEISKTNFTLVKYLVSWNIKMEFSPFGKLRK